jgi:hypothetical protein
MRIGPVASSRLDWPFGLQGQGRRCGPVVSSLAVPADA